MLHCMKKIRILCCVIAVVALLCSCSAQRLPSEPVRTASHGGGSDDVRAIAQELKSGDANDIQALRTLSALSTKTYETEPQEREVSIDGKTYAVTYTGSQTVRSISSGEEDVYRGKSEAGEIITVMFAHGSSSRIIGYSMYPNDEKYNEASPEMETLPEERLVEIARAAAAQYTDMDYYNDHAINFREETVAGVTYCGWYEVYFYSVISGIRASDLTQVRVFPDGRVWWVTTPGVVGISAAISENVDTARLDSMADEKLTAMYGAEGQPVRMESKELISRYLMLDDNGAPVVVYSYKVNLDPTDSTKVCLVEFAKVGIWLG